MGGIVVHVGVVRVLEDGAPMIVFGDEFLHLPVVLLGADGEFEILARDGIPVL